ncbi:MAG: hypothetical protein QS721_02210 [Candidatus Endonucleobacter sp. (ex Gigantidas childressi)]|nr:hypothetical protein [Candidatus Endonucleobacter sp. (ex Gigantidas childressi)]
MAYRKLFFILVAILSFEDSVLAYDNRVEFLADKKSKYFDLGGVFQEQAPFQPLVMSQSMGAEDFTVEADADAYMGKDKEYPNDNIYSETWLDALWGGSVRNRLCLGMWTYHVNSKNKDDNNSNNQLLGVTYNSYYCGTFINTHFDRVWSLGVQRSWYKQRYGILDVDLGYRIGVLYGYKKHLTLCGTPFFPLLQVVADFTYKNIGIQLSWAGVVGTIGFLVGF